MSRILLLISALSLLITPIVACTFMVTDLYYTTELTIIDANQAYFGLGLTGQATPSHDLSDQKVYLDFKNNVAGFERFPQENESKWERDVSLTENWFEENDGINLKEHLMQEGVIVEINNGSEWIANISVPDFIADFFFISFYYPLDGNVYIVSEFGSTLSFDLENFETNYFNASLLYGSIDSSSVPSKNFGLLKVYPPPGSCEGKRYFLPTFSGFHIISRGATFRRVSIDPKSHSIYEIPVYVSDKVTIIEKNYITLENDSWSFTLSSLLGKATTLSTINLSWLPLFFGIMVASGKKNKLKPSILKLISIVNKK